jgi:hypothetical protein
MPQSSLTADEDPIRTSGPPVADEVAPTPYFTSNFTRSISDEAIATLVERFATAPSPLSMVYFQQLGNAANRVGEPETACSHRDALCEWGCDAVWLDLAADAANIRWSRAMADPMLPFTTGTVYVNHIGLKPRAMVNKPSVEKGLMERRCHE